MQLNTSRRTLTLAALLLVWSALSASLAAQTQTRPRPQVRTNDSATYRHAYEHGYRAGYEDGFLRGKADLNDNQAPDYERSDAYQRADRTYETRMGTRTEYQESYRIGFELAYQDGYYGRGYTVTIPTNLGRIIQASNAPVAAAPSERARPIDDRRTDDRRPTDDRSTTNNRPYDDRPTTSGRSSDDRVSTTRGTVRVADGIEMKVRLSSPISTKTNREGDRFTAVVLDPSQYADAVLTGHIAKLTKSGRATGKTELALVFDTIELRDGRRGTFAAQVEKVYESETVKEIDEEGNVRTGSRTKDTAVRSGGGAVLGAIIGGIAGGGKGAAIGAAIGAGVGAGSVFVQDGKDLELDPGTEMLIRSAAPARTRD